MSSINITRRVRTFPITLHSTTSLATTLPMGEYAGAAMSIGTISENSQNLQLFGCDTESGTFRRIYGSDGSAADITLSPSSTEARIYNLPDAAFAVPFVKIVSGGTNSTGTQAVVMFKS
jgi:hypothetical protein